jgi:hypothetical protein
MQQSADKRENTFRMNGALVQPIDEAATTATTTMVSVFVFQFHRITNTAQRSTTIVLLSLSTINSININLYYQQQ